eukprot:TRINITY_DN2285_c0_g1_i1.p1 TRINITY_DN2285_c0_g1~~TRINITY_DN2285_c0_g1_i1.p1  ORF type:complete len:489 (+),score=191.04 TRINITY_DN2285_c0_g1_i1:245-1711(+)
MFKTTVVLSLALVLALASSGVHARGPVAALTKDNFDHFIGANPVTLVEFYAPWCGHCKRLEPEYNKAAELLGANEDVALSKVDATEEPELAQEHGVRGYPTLKVFRKNKEGERKVSEYNGPRDAKGIAAYMEKQAGPAAKVIKSVEQMKAYLKGGELVVAAFYSDDSDPDFADFTETAETHREAFRWAAIHDADVAKALGHENEIVLYRDQNMVSKKYDEAEVVYTEKVTPARLVAWIEQNANTLVNHRTEKTIRLLRMPNQPLLTMFYNVDFDLDPKGSNYLANRLRRVAKDFKNQVTFSVANSKDLAQEFADYGFTQGQTGVGITDGAGRKYKMETEWSVDNMRKFVEQYIAGELEPWIKSEPIPADNSGPVTTLVAKNFDEIVNDESKDVLVEFYAPWCGHCKSLAPKWEELGEKFAKNDNIVIAKMDATANDVPPQFGVRGYPTIFWVPSNKKKSPVKYEGAREVSDFAAYIKKHATVTLKEDL